MCRRFMYIYVLLARLAELIRNDHRVVGDIRRSRNRYVRSGLIRRPQIRDTASRKQADGIIHDEAIHTDAQHIDMDGIRARSAGSQIPHMNDISLRLLRGDYDLA